MRLIDADALDKVKLHPLPYTHITPADADAESYKRGWNDAIDAIMIEAPTIENAEFWQKRADEYYKICCDLIVEMQGGVKFNSVKIDANGITFIKGQGEEHETD